MAHTAVADLITHDGFSSYFFQDMLAKSAFIKSGIAARDSRIDEACQKAGSGGKFVDLPYFDSLDGASDDEVVTEGEPLTVNAVTAGQDRAVICRRGKAFGENDLAVDIASKDPMADLSARLVGYWDKMNGKRLVAVLNGAFADNVANDSSDLVLDISGETGDAGLLGKDSIMLAAQLLGDRKLELTGVAMHSMVETYLAGLDTNAGLYRASDGPASLAKYNGRDIIVDDLCSYDSTNHKAEIYLFGNGAVAFNPVPTKVPFELVRDGLYSRSAWVSRVSSIMHLRGIKWKSDTANPGNTVLATATNWDRVYPQKAIRCVKLIARLA